MPDATRYVWATLGLAAATTKATSSFYYTPTFSVCSVLYGCTHPGHLIAPRATLSCNVPPDSAARRTCDSLDLHKRLATVEPSSIYEAIFKGVHCFWVFAYLFEIQLIV